jgi:hypothetical protein
MSPGARSLILASYALAGALFATGTNAQTYFDPGTFPPKLSEQDLADLAIRPNEKHLPPPEYELPQYRAHPGDRGREFSQSLPQPVRLAPASTPKLKTRLGARQT